MFLLTGFIVFLPAPKLGFFEDLQDMFETYGF